MITSILGKINSALGPTHQETSPHTAARVPPTVEFLQASEWDDVRAAYDLVYRNYVERGLIRPNASGLRFTHYNLLHESATFVAKSAGRVIATLSLIPEAPKFGLPMDELYRPELDELRGRGLRLAEGSGLAIDPAFQAISLNLMMNLVKMAVVYSRKLGITDDVVACHPRHAKFYKRVFLFREVGGLRAYHSVNDAPAVALRLDVGNLDKVYREDAASHGPGIYRFFFSDEIFRCRDAALRAGAFSQEVTRRLCEAQPAVAQALEAIEPGLATRLTGRPTAALPQELRSSGANHPLWEAPPIFVAA